MHPRYRNIEKAYGKRVLATRGQYVLYKDYWGYSMVEQVRGQSNALEWYASAITDHDAFCRFYMKWHHK